MKYPSNSSVLYLDYNATHPPIPEILQEALENYQSSYFNPSGITRFSLKNQGKIESARKYFAELSSKPADSLVFSSTGTESNYFLLHCIALRFPTKEILVSPYEHSSIWQGLHDLGFQCTELPGDKSGELPLMALETELKKKPRPLVCLYAGNETGVIQPIHEISEILARYGMPLFSDAMQALGKIPIAYHALSGFTCSGHKIGGGMGASLCYFEDLRKDVHLLGGGNQENGHRAGTENHFAIQAFAESSRYQEKALIEKTARTRSWREQIESHFQEWGAHVVAESSPRLPNTSFLILPIEDMDFFFMGLEEAGICIATGSSCKSRAREAPRTLLRMGYSPEEGLRAIRISTGIFNTELEVSRFLEVSKKLLHSLAS